MWDIFGLGPKWPVCYKGSFSIKWLYGSSFKRECRFILHTLFGSTEFRILHLKFWILHILQNCFPQFWICIWESQCEVKGVQISGILPESFKLKYSTKWQKKVQANQPFYWRGDGYTSLCFLKKIIHYISVRKYFD